MKILITGGTGFLGVNLQQVLKEQAPEAQVYIFSRRTGGNVQNWSQVEAAVKDKDLVIHAAAHTSISSSLAGAQGVDRQFFDTNVGGTINVLQACRKYGVKMIFISTAEIYGDNQRPGKPMTESHPLAGRSGSYTISKMAAEQYCRLGFETQGDDVVILRLFTMYGPYQTQEKAIPLFLRLAKEGKPLPLNDDGQQRRDYVHVRDVARAIWAARNLPAGTVCNVSSGRNYTMRQVAKLIQTAMRRRGKRIKIENRPARPNDVREFLGSYKKLTRLTGWQPKLFLEDQITELVDWYLACEPLPASPVFFDEAERDLIPQKNEGIEYASAVYGKREIQAVIEVLEGRWLAPAERTQAMERSVSTLFGKKYGLMVNSGSSANLLAVAALKLPPGSEVIVPAGTFPTTFAPILQRNLIPVVVDNDVETLNIRLDQIEEAISEKTRAIIVQHTYGNLNDLRRLREIADRHGLKLIEDSCDTIGGTLASKPTGTWSDVTTTSFYFVHHITAAGGGGMVMFHDRELYERAYSMRDWGRQSLGYDEDLDKRYAKKVAGMPFDAKFLFTEEGFNFKGIEAQAAFGLVQLERLPIFLRRRSENVAQLRKFFEQYPEFFILPKSLPEAEVSWLTLPITLQDDAPFTRLELVKFLEYERHIQTRPLWGNIVRHPAYQKTPVRIVGDLKGADKLMRDTVLVPCHHGLTWKNVEYIIDSYRTFVERFKSHPSVRVRRRVSAGVQQEVVT